MSGALERLITPHASAAPAKRRRPILLPTQHKSSTLGRYFAKEVGSCSRSCSSRRRTSFTSGVLKLVDPDGSLLNRSALSIIHSRGFNRNPQRSTPPELPGIPTHLLFGQMVGSAQRGRAAVRAVGLTISPKPQHLSYANFERAGFPARSKTPTWGGMSISAVEATPESVRARSFASGKRRSSAVIRSKRPSDASHCPGSPCASPLKRWGVRGSWRPLRGTACTSRLTRSLITRRTSEMAAAPLVQGDENRLEGAPVGAEFERDAEPRGSLFSADDQIVGEQFANLLTQHLCRHTR
jgi:hypothetical protein